MLRLILLMNGALTDFELGVGRTKVVFFLSGSELRMAH